MSKHELTRRELLRLSTAAAISASLPSIAHAEPQQPPSAAHAPAPHSNLYSSLLQTWCDGLLAHQETSIHKPALFGGLLCPACVLIHGRCGDAVYPLLRVARTTGEDKYLRAAVLVHNWSEAQVSRPDGSWVNDVTLSSWQGITVFHAISLAEALHHHGELLDAATRKSWTDRLARAAKFLDGFITIQTGNINYPITASFCFAVCGQVLGNSHYVARGRELAHTALNYFTPNNLLFGEGHPQTGLSAKHCRPIDLGYNVEESLPALAQYALLTNDKPVLDQTIAALRTHMEFMLPDGAWDNSWGSRNYKWSWWGSRTSDGCHPAYVLLAEHDPHFLEVARRNLELMAACTHDGLLYGGPDYLKHGDLPCIHHTFTHAKSLATVLDRATGKVEPTPRLSLPREEARGLKHYPEIGTYLAAVGDWRTTVTENDWEYVEDVQPGHGGASGGGHASGGAMSLLYHRKLGPILTASMTKYQMIEISNQQAFRDPMHMPLTPRIEYASHQTYTSLSDFKADLSATAANNAIHFSARGQMLTAAHQPISSGEMRYHLAYNFSESSVQIVAEVITTSVKLSATPRFIFPIIASSSEKITQPAPGTIRIAKPTGTLIVRTNASGGFEPVPQHRTFNLVPGFECVPLTIAMQPGHPVQIQLEFSSGS
ncbi:MAG TPA: hypothetical protein VFE38_07315 [Edaphobacter sp.]|nr:hypothetical protein [Edaphobacter sp.]